MAHKTEHARTHTHTHSYTLLMYSIALLTICLAASISFEAEMPVVRAGLLLLSEHCVRTTISMYVALPWRSKHYYVQELRCRPIRGERSVGAGWTWHVQY